MLETHWRAWRLKRRLKAYARWEQQALSRNDFGGVFDWLTGGWPQEMVATLPTWILETCTHADPKLIRATRDRVESELARRTAIRSQIEARWSLIVAALSMLISLGSWLVK